MNIIILKILFSNKIAKLEQREALIPSLLRNTSEIQRNPPRGSGFESAMYHPSRGGVRGGRDRKMNL